MKKFIVTAICAVVAFCSISFAACSSDSGLINLADCEIGYELPVYPDCEFDYKVSDDCTVHISEIKAVLTAKNEVNEGDVVESDWYPYTITVETKGYVVTDNLNKSLYIVFNVMPSNSGGYGGSIIAQSDTTFFVQFSISVYDASYICFVRII